MQLLPQRFPFLFLWYRDMIYYYNNSEPAIDVASTGSERPQNVTFV